MSPTVERSPGAPLLRLLPFMVVMALLHSAAAFSCARRHVLGSVRRPPPPLPRHCCYSSRGGNIDQPPRAADYSDDPDAPDDDDDDEGDETAMQHAGRYSISGRGKGSAATVTTNTGHVILTDVPAKMGGGDSAPQPVEHLLAALVGCTQATAMYVSRNMNPRLVIDRMDFDIRAIRDERGALMHPVHEVPSIPARLTHVHGTIKVHFKKKKGTSSSSSSSSMVVVTREQLRVLAEQTEARCPIANMMHMSGCVMDIEWTNGRSDDESLQE